MTDCDDNDQDARTYFIELSDDEAAVLREVLTAKVHLLSEMLMKLNGVPNLESGEAEPPEFAPQLTERDQAAVQLITDDGPQTMADLRSKLGYSHKGAICARDRLGLRVAYVTANNTKHYVLP